MYRSLRRLWSSTATDNVLVGYAVGYANGGANQLSTGYANVMVGGYNAVASETDNNTFILGHSLTGKGTQTFFVGGTNGAYNSANSSSWSTTSDRRLKKNIDDCNIGLEEINKIKVREFEYKTEEEITELDGKIDKIDVQGVQVGVIAQEIQEVLPSVVKETSQGVLSVEPDNITWHLVKAVQELTVKVKELEEKLND